MGGARNFTIKERERSKPVRCGRRIARIESITNNAAILSGFAQAVDISRRNGSKRKKSDQRRPHNLNAQCAKRMLAPIIGSFVIRLKTRMLPNERKYARPR